MAQTITIKKSSLETKIKFIGYLFFGELSTNELNVLALLVKNSINGTLDISSNMGKSLKKQSNLNDNSFSVSLHRLVIKKALNKNKGVISLHPVLNNLDTEQIFSIKFIAEDKPVIG